MGASKVGRKFIFLRRGVPSSTGQTVPPAGWLGGGNVITGGCLGCVFNIKLEVGIKADVFQQRRQQRAGLSLLLRFGDVAVCNLPA